MVHTVSISEEGLAAERDQLADLAGFLPAPQAQAGGDASSEPNQQVIPSDGLESWRAAVQLGFGAVANFGAPNWDISPRGRELLCDGLAEQMAEWFPTGPLGIDFNHCPPWVKLLGGAGFIAYANFDQERFRLKPLRMADDEGQEEAGGSASASDDIANVDESPRAKGTFSTEGG